MLQLNHIQIAKWRENVVISDRSTPPVFTLIGQYLGIDLVNTSIDEIYNKVEDYIITDKRFKFMEGPFEIAASMVNKLTYIPYEEALQLVCERAEIRPNAEFLQVLDCYLETGIVAWDAFDEV
jgi:hypothetical protein